MAGTKRTREGQPLDRDDYNPRPRPTAISTTTTTMNMDREAPASTAGLTGHADVSSSMVTSIFGTFRDELDRHHDRRERIIKTSRDITALSKKIIFSLQRVRSLNCPLPPAIAKDTSARLAQIVELFRSVVPDVTGINSWRYQRQLSGGIQEFIEALSFNHYVQFQTLITLEEIRRQLPAEILVTEEDYIMGLFDLTGEMMRFAVTSLSAGMVTHKPQHQHPTHPARDTDMPGSITGSSMDETSPMQSMETSTSTTTTTTTTSTTNNNPSLPSSQAGIVVDLRGMRSSFESLSVPHRYGMLRDLSKKLDIMQGSVEKVERAAYGILVRGSERPSGWVPDLSGPAEVESF